MGNSFPSSLPAKRWRMRTEGLNQLFPTFRLLQELRPSASLRNRCELEANSETDSSGAPVLSCLARTHRVLEPCRSRLCSASHEHCRPIKSKLTWHRSPGVVYASLLCIQIPTMPFQFLLSLSCCTWGFVIFFFFNFRVPGFWEQIKKLKHHQI